MVRRLHDPVKNWIETEHDILGVPFNGRIDVVSMVSPGAVYHHNLHQTL